MWVLKVRAAASHKPWLFHQRLFGQADSVTLFPLSVGGWVVTYMMSVRHGAPLASAIVSTGFWIGITLGRVFLAFVIPMLGECLAVWIYLLCIIVLEILFWRLSNFVVSAVMVAFLGFFMAPYSISPWWQQPSSFRSGCTSAPSASVLPLAAVAPQCKSYWKTPRVENILPGLAKLKVGSRSWSALSSTPGAWRAFSR